MPGPGGRDPSTRTDIARTPQQVFDFLSDTANWTRLDRALISMTPHGPVSIGTAGKATHRRAGGMRATTSWTVTDLVPGVRLAMRIVGRGYQLTETIELGSRAAGTTVDVTDRLVASSWLGRLMVPFSRGIIEGDLRARSATLKALLETRAAPVP